VLRRVPLHKEQRCRGLTLLSWGSNIPAHVTTPSAVHPRKLRSPPVATCHRHPCIRLPAGMARGARGTFRVPPVPQRSGEPGRV